ncbi:hypothetical protein YC2023_031599 [Brassica napus]
MSICLSSSSNRHSRHPSLNLRVSPYFVIHGFIPAGRANHYMSSLKTGSIVKVECFEVVRCSSMYKIIDHPFLICFISPTIIDEVIMGARTLRYYHIAYGFIISMWLGKSVMSKVLTLVKKQLESLSVSSLIRDTTDNPDRHNGGNNISTCSLFLPDKIAYMPNVNICKEARMSMHKDCRLLLLP